MSGKVVLEDSGIADGTDVVVVTHEPDDDVAMVPEERAELAAGIAEADRGEMIPAAAIFEELRRHG